jgi:hypothetical protein
MFVLLGIIVDGGDCGILAVPSGHACISWFGVHVSVVSNPKCRFSYLCLHWKICDACIEEDM